MKPIEDHEKCKITVADEGECFWTSKSGVCAEGFFCDILYRTNSTDACPISAYEPLVGTPDVPQEPNNQQCEDAVMLEPGIKINALVKLDDVRYGGEHPCGTCVYDLSAGWYALLGTGNDVTVHVCTNYNLVTRFGVTANFGVSEVCSDEDCVGYPEPLPDPPSCSRNITLNVSFFAESNVLYHVYVLSEYEFQLSFDIWYEVHPNITIFESVPTGDTTIGREGLLVGESFGSEDTLLVERSAVGNTTTSTYALLEFTFDLEAISLATTRLYTELCLNRLPRVVDFDAVHNYSICRLSQLPKGGLESLTGLQVNYTMPDQCLQNKTVGFEIGPSTEDVVCVNITGLLLDLETEEVSVNLNDQRRLSPLDTETFLFMIDNLVESDYVGDRFYSRSVASDGHAAPPILRFISVGNITVTPDPPARDVDCDVSDDSMTCHAMESIDVNGQIVLLDASLTCPMDATGDYKTFQHASQVPDTCGCLMLTKQDGDDFDLGCKCYACPEGSALEFSYVCETVIVDSCLSFNCNGTCNGAIDNIWNNSTDPPTKPTFVTATPDIGPTVRPSEAPTFAATDITREEEQEDPNSGTSIQRHYHNFLGKATLWTVAASFITFFFGIV
ncbi:hypothetical protein IV203_019984 [Nitzschia inconspicua]|uniref:Uncharacterized protein n=1 Tax=Nitzschia inconspicua TaxID=303405 RepID=A0A9K3Q7V0_9STRA|nr:hypothetical protein IV203_019984 [Nitzschia inconspicua]